jgi:hypothetical protein
MWLLIGLRALCCRLVDPIGHDGTNVIYVRQW